MLFRSFFIQQKRKFAKFLLKYVMILLYLFFFNILYSIREYIIIFWKFWKYNALKTSKNFHLNIILHVNFNSNGDIFFVLLYAFFLADNFRIVCYVFFIVVYFFNTVFYFKPFAFFWAIGILAIPFLIP